MNMAMALKALMGAGDMAVDETGRTPRGPRMDRQTANDAEKDSRLDRLPSISDVGPMDEYGDMFPDRESFLSTLDPVAYKSTDQNMMPAESGEPRALDILMNRAFPDSFGETVDPENQEQMIQKEFGPAMRGRDLSIEDIIKFMQENSDTFQEDTANSKSPQGLIEDVLKNKVMQMQQRGQ